MSIFTYRLFALQVTVEIHCFVNSSPSKHTCIYVIYVMHICLIKINIQNDQIELGSIANLVY